MSRTGPAEGGRKVVAVNRRARHEYDILDTMEAGLVLTGTEIKSIRNGRAQITDGYARIENGEAWVYNLQIAHYEQGNRANVETTRRRKLLLHRREIDRLTGKLQSGALTLIPLTLYLRNGYAKLELATARGRKLYDRREAIADREAQRDQEREVRGRGSRE